MKCTVFIGSEESPSANSPKHSTTAPKPSRSKATSTIACDRSKTSAANSSSISSTHSTPSGSKARRPSCSASLKPCSGKSPTGSSSPAATSAIAAHSARPSPNSKNSASSTASHAWPSSTPPAPTPSTTSTKTKAYASSTASSPTHHRRLLRRTQPHRLPPSHLATAIEISRPVNLKKCLRALALCDGVVREVSDADILEAKATVGRYGLGCEPASAASVAGLKLLRQQGVITPDQRVVCILTGHHLKDPNVTVNYHMEAQGQLSNRPIEVANDIDQVIKTLTM